MELHAAGVGCVLGGGVGLFCRVTTSAYVHRQYTYTVYYLVYGMCVCLIIIEIGAYVCVHAMAIPYNTIGAGRKNTFVYTIAAQQHNCAKPDELLGGPRAVAVV